MPRSSAPVRNTTVMNPPIERMNRKTSTEPNIVPLLKGPTIPVSRSWIPYIPFTGASSRSSTRPPRSSGGATYRKEPAIGLVPDLAGTKPLVDIVGLPRALELCLTARTVDAAEAARLRLAELVVPSADLDAAVADLVAALLAIEPPVSRAVKELLAGAPARTLEQQAAAERQAQAALQQARQAR